MKVKNIILYIAFSLLFSCKVQEQQRILSGSFKYTYNYSNKVEKIILKEDGSFVFTSYCGECVGKWRYIAKDSILIQCNKPSLAETLTQCYISLRERRIKVLNIDRIKMPINGNVRYKYLIMKRF